MQCRICQTSVEKTKIFEKLNNSNRISENSAVCLLEAKMYNVPLPWYFNISCDRCDTRLGHCANLLKRMEIWQMEQKFQLIHKNTNSAIYTCFLCLKPAVLKTIHIPKKETSVILVNLLKTFTCKYIPKQGYINMCENCYFMINELKILHKMAADASFTYYDKYLKSILQLPYNNLVFTYEPFVKIVCDRTMRQFHYSTDENGRMEVAIRLPINKSFFNVCIAPAKCNCINKGCKKQNNPEILTSRDPEMIREKMKELQIGLPANEVDHSTVIIRKRFSGITIEKRAELRKKFHYDELFKNVRAPKNMIYFKSKYFDMHNAMSTVQEELTFLVSKKAIDDCKDKFAELEVKPDNEAEFAFGLIITPKICSGAIEEAAGTSRKNTN